MVRKTVARPTSRTLRRISSTEKWPPWARTAVMTAAREGVALWSAASSLRMTESSSDRAVIRGISETKYHTHPYSLSRAMRRSALVSEFGDQEHLARLVRAFGAFDADADGEGVVRGG